MSVITDNDYKKILEYYEKPIPRSKRLLKLEAETILATKLCRCIKKVDVKNESRSIGICTKSVINNKGYTKYKYNIKLFLFSFFFRNIHNNTCCVVRISAEIFRSKCLVSHHKRLTHSLSSIALIHF